MTRQPQSFPDSSSSSSSSSQTPYNTPNNNEIAAARLARAARRDDDEDSEIEDITAKLERERRSLAAAESLNLLAGTAITPASSTKAPRSAFRRVAAFRREETCQPIFESSSASSPQNQSAAVELTPAAPRQLPRKLYDAVYQVIRDSPGLERLEIRDRVLKEYGRSMASTGATLSDARFRPGGGKPLWLERSGRFYPIAIDVVRQDFVNNKPIKTPLECSSNACVLCGDAKQSRPHVLRCDGCGASVHGSCTSPQITPVDCIETFYCCKDCQQYAEPKQSRPFPGVVLYDGIGEAIRRFVQARNLTITFSDSVNENTANIETHTHTHTETLFVASGELVVSTGIRDQLRIGAGQAVTITKGTAHSIRFDRPRTVYVYARHLDEEDMIDVKGGISQQEFLHETECDRLVEFQKKEHVKAMKEKNNDIARLRSQLVDAKNQIEKLFAYKKNLKRKFDQIVDNWPQETGEIAEA